MWNKKSKPGVANRGAVSPRPRSDASRGAGRTEGAEKEKVGREAPQLPLPNQARVEVDGERRDELRSAQRSLVSDAMRTRAAANSKPHEPQCRCLAAGTQHGRAARARRPAGCVRARRCGRGRRTSRAHAAVVKNDTVRYVRVTTGIALYHSSTVCAMAAAPRRSRAAAGEGGRSAQASVRCVQTRAAAPAGARARGRRR